MILQKLVDTNLLFIPEHTAHSWESAVLTLGVAIACFVLFIFWKYKRALINFQAWSLLLGLINLILFFHFSPFSIHIKYNELEYQFTPTVLRYLMLLQFLTSAITIWRFWELSEKYIPKDILYQKRYFKKDEIHRTPINKRFLAHGLAVWHIIKNGGNNVGNDAKVRKNIKNALKKEVKL